MRLLSVDWDYFFAEDPDWDWSHSENAPFFYEIAWSVRAMDFYRAGRDLPGTTGDEAGFWGRFRFKPGARLYVAESHAGIWRLPVRRGVNRVVNYDAHHDAGYGQDLKGFVEAARVECDNWSVAYRQCLGAEVRAVLPRWRERLGPGELTCRTAVPIRRDLDDGRPDPEPFDRVFLCRSPAWAPSWLDAAFEAFVAACPLGPPVLLDAWRNPDYRLGWRKYDDATARAAAELHAGKLAEAQAILAQGGVR